MSEKHGCYANGLGGCLALAGYTTFWFVFGFLLASR